MKTIESQKVFGLLYRKFRGVLVLNKKIRKTVDFCAQIGMQRSKSPNFAK
jgi:hypothetical protein